MNNIKFENILNFMIGKIPLDQLERVREIFMKSYATIALECLCSQISDYEVIMTREVFEDLKSLCEDKGVDPSYLNYIREYVKEK